MIEQWCLCGRKYEFPDDAYGERHKCNKCGARFVIDSPLYTVEKPKKRKGPRMKREEPDTSWQSAAFIVACLGLAAAVVIIGVFCSGRYGG